MILINASQRDALKIFQPFLPIFPPIGIGCLVALCDKLGIKNRFIDLQVEEAPLALVKEYIKEMEPPYIFAFSVLTAAYQNAVSFSKQLKSMYPNSVIIFGGIHPSALPEEVLANEHVEIAFGGEGEAIFPKLYYSIKEGRDYTHLPNISYRKDGKVITNPRAPIISNLDELPSYPYHLFKSKKYVHSFVLGSRGCPYKCIFCSNRVTTGLRYRYRNSEIIADELEMLYKDYGQNNILFLDDNFLVNKNRIYSLIDIIRKRGLEKKMSFNFQARGDNTDPKLMQDLYDAGFRSVFYGIETASEKIMQTIQKGETVQECIDAVKISKKIGYHVSATFIYSLPGETHQDRMDAVRLSRELELDMVRFNNATPYPGTLLYQIAKKENRLNIQGVYENFFSVSTFIENPFKKIPFTYVPLGNTEEGIRRDILLSYILFYLDFKRLKGIFVSPEKGMSWFSAGEQMVEFVKKIPALIFLLVMLTVKFGSLFLDIALGKHESMSLLDVVKAIFGKWPEKLSKTDK